MSEENISLYDLLNLSIATRQKGCVNFTALHALLLAVLKQLDIREVTTRWRDSESDDRAPDTLVDVGSQDLKLQDEDEKNQHVRSGIELLDGGGSAGSLTSASGSAADEQRRIQTCEDGVSEMMDAQVEMMAAVEKCCHRVDALEEAVSFLRTMFQRYPDPEELNLIIESASLSERENLQKTPVKSGVSDGAMMTKPTSPPAGPHPTIPSSPRLPSDPSPTPAATCSPTLSGENVVPQEAVDVSEASPTLPGLLPQTEAGLAAPDVAPSQKSSGSKHDPEMMEALRDMGKLQIRFMQLEARIVALEERKADQTQLTQLRELVANKGSRDASNSLMNQLNQQGALMESFKRDQEKLDNLEDMLMSPDRESASESVETDSKVSCQLRQQVSYLRTSVHKLEEDMKHLRMKQALCEERAADQHLQDQLDDLRGMLEDMILSFTSHLSSSLQHEAEQGSSESQDLSQSSQRSAFTAKTVNIGRKLSLLVQHYESLQETVNRLVHQQSGGRAGRPLEDRETSRNVGVLNHVQKVILELQVDCEKLHETTRSLHEDNKQKHGHIQELYKVMEEIEGKKADREMVENKLKADKSDLDSKVSRLQFDSATEQLNAMFHELLNKVTGQEQDWHKVINKLSTEMECKLNRIELDSLKKQLEDRWRNIHQKLQAQGAPEHEDAAAIRKQLVERFYCLSCDRPIVKHVPGPHVVTLPSSPAFPSHKSMRAFSIYGGMEHLRRHYRRMRAGSNSGSKRQWQRRSYADMCKQLESLEIQRWNQNQDQHPAGVEHERISELTDYSQLAVPRSCGGNHTTTSSSQRRSGLQQTKLHSQPEVDGVFQEVDIIGLDGHIYKGRVNVPSIKNTETKLPTISSKDTMSKTKDKAKSSASHRPAASLEVGHNTPVLHHSLSAKSMQCSRSASSCSGRDWPVSALGCYTSQSSITQASAAAESGADPQSDEPLNL
ncbi:glutamine-rich protein 2 [Melanotaenia boesemani]|uniref:glutamine-rich protein 2 n=1 Tax=Melanotaenia boesemani TaxID=1250792 RepID=UPI001C04129A|nr:glutamine-rich protein 2 [Melanotaenia boesemani]